ncbi:general stress protein [Metaplanococcus flavidus]|uniref:General stress protein n=1 Tax=Metaplanococcus flavidus TaxID=569883 RepID=A0ABW3L921_9BACL
MKTTNREFEVVYTARELEEKVEEMKSWGYNKNEIHVLANNADVLNSVESQEGVHTHEIETITDKFKSMFTGKDAVREELTKLDLSQSEIDEFHDILDNDGIILYTDYRNDKRTF